MCDEDSIERVIIKMVNVTLDDFPERDRNDENKNFGNNSIPPVKPIRKTPSIGTVTTASSSSIGSLDNNQLPSPQPPHVIHVSSNPSSTLRADSVELNLEESSELLKLKLGNASGSEKSFREASLYKRSPRNALSNSTDSSVADEKIGKKFSKYSPSYRHGVLSQKDELGRKEPKSVDLKQKLTGTVTKRQKIISMTTAKAGSNHGAARPISMSLARRKSVVSKRFDTDTLDLLESLNLINKNDSERQDTFEDDPTQLYFSPNGESNCDDGVYNDETEENVPTVVRVKSDASENANSFNDHDDVRRKDTATFDKMVIPSPAFNTMDVIYEENTPRPEKDKFFENSPYYFSTNASPANPKVKLNEIKARKLIRKHSQRKISTTSPRGANQIRGLLDGKGLLEFCTVDADLSSLLLDNSVEKEIKTGKKTKKSVYDIDDFPDDKTKSNFTASYSSCIPPIKSHCAPSQNFSIEHIHDFCFPSGVPVHFYPQDKADRLTNTTGG
jgi:hypothetical protein